MELFRPEFTAKNDGLNPDAFAPVPDVLPDHKQLQQLQLQFQSKINAACSLLFDRIIPEVASKLSLEEPPAGPPNPTMSRRMHHEGINMRYLGLVRKATHSEGWGAVLLEEMVTRAAKVYLRAAMRATQRNVRTIRQQPYRECVRDTLCLILGTSTESRMWWSTSSAEGLKVW